MINRLSNLTSSIYNLQRCLKKYPKESLTEISNLKQHQLNGLFHGDEPRILTIVGKSHVFGMVELWNEFEKNREIGENLRQSKDPKEELVEYMHEVFLSDTHRDEEAERVVPPLRGPAEEVEEIVQVKANKPVKPKKKFIYAED